jgi:hypothetical protein
MSEYRSDVDGVADDVMAFVNGRDDDGELREAVLEYVHELIGGHSRVIYTKLAQEGLAESDNDGTYVEDFGTDGLTRDGCLNWSALMYAAMERDVYECLDHRGFDINDPEAWKLEQVEE